MTEQEMYERAPERPRPSLPNEEYYRPVRAPQPAGAARLGALLVIVGLIWLAVELIGYGPFFGSSQGTTLIQAPLPGNRLELDLGSGDVELQAGSEQDVRVETTQHGWWQGQPVAVERLADHVLVRNEAHSALFGLCFGRCGLTYRITVPRDISLTVRTTSGDINASGAAGSLSLATGSGDVEANDIPSGVTVSTSSGDVQLSDVGGKLDVQTSSGDVQLDAGRVDGATVRTSSGDVELDGVAGALALQSSSGDITVRDARDSRLDIQTTSGEVDYAGSLASGDSSVASSSGEVTLHLPAGSGFVLEASTSSGDLRSDFELRGGKRDGRSLSGIAGAGGARLKIATSSGDIAIVRE
jgi:putative adhesin